MRKITCALTQFTESARESIATLAYIAAREKTSAVDANCFLAVRARVVPELCSLRYCMLINFHMEIFTVGSNTVRCYMRRHADRNHLKLHRRK